MKKITMIDDKQWRGYTLEEMRYQRAASLARCVIARQSIDRICGRIFGFGEVSRTQSVAMSLLGAVSGNLKVLDYALIGFKIMRSLLKMWRRIKH